jgi:dTMP kinase
MLVAIEGIDGAGKHTQTELLKHKAEAEGLHVGLLSFPRYGETVMARSVADYLNGKFGAMGALPPHFPALLYAGDRFESRDVIHRLLATSDVLLIDRYVASNLAHQVAKVRAEEQDAFIAWLTQIEHEVYGLPQPDVTVYLDVPVAVAAALIAKKKPRTYTDAAADLHERDLDYLATCRDVYQVLAHRNHGSPWITVACTDGEEVLRDPQAIHAEVWDALQGLLQPRAASR